MTTPNSGTVFVTTHDLELGLTKRACPYCDMPVLIRLPSMHDAILGRESAAMRLGLQDLTPTERRIFDTVYEFYPQAVSREAVEAVLGGEAMPMLHQTLKENLTRMRRKIGPKGWRLTMLHGSLRLVEPQPVVDVEGEGD